MEIEISDDTALRNEMLVIGQTHVGGCNELCRLEREDKIIKKTRTSDEDVFVEMAGVVRDWAAKPASRKTG